MKFEPWMLAAMEEAGYMDYDDNNADSEEDAEAEEYICCNTNKTKYKGPEFSAKKTEGNSMDKQNYITTLNIKDKAHYDEFITTEYEDRVYAIRKKYLKDCADYNTKAKETDCIIQPQIERLTEEYKSRVNNEAIANLKAKIENQQNNISDIQANIDNWSKQLSSLGIFQIGQKKELKARIDAEQSKKLNAEKAIREYTYKLDTNNLETDKAIADYKNKITAELQSKYGIKEPDENEYTYHNVFGYDQVWADYQINQYMEGHTQFTLAQLRAMDGCSHITENHIKNFCRYGKKLAEKKLDNNVYYCFEYSDSREKNKEQIFNFLSMNTGLAFSALTIRSIVFGNNNQIYNMMVSTDLHLLEQDWLIRKTTERNIAYFEVNNYRNDEFLKRRVNSGEATLKGVLSEMTACSRKYTKDRVYNYLCEKEGGYRSVSQIWWALYETDNSVTMAAIKEEIDVLVEKGVVEKCRLYEKDCYCVDYEKIKAKNSKAVADFLKRRAGKLFTVKQIFENVFSGVEYIDEDKLLNMLKVRQENKRSKVKSKTENGETVYFWEDNSDKKTEDKNAEESVNSAADTIKPESDNKTDKDISEAAVQATSAETAKPVITDAKLNNKLNSILKRLEEYYPDKVIEGGIDKQHNKLSKNIGELYKKIGFEDRKSFLAAYGYKYIFKDDNKGGRPKTVSAEKVIEAIRNKYPEGKVFNSFLELAADNQEYAGNLKTIRNRANELFGMSFNEYLIQIGFVREKAKPKVEKKYYICTVKIPLLTEERCFISESKMIHQDDYVEIPIGNGLRAVGIVTKAELYTETSAPCDIKTAEYIIIKSNKTAYNTQFIKSVIGVNVSDKITELLQNCSKTTFEKQDVKAIEMPGRAPWAICRGLTVEIIKVIDHLVKKEKEVYSYDDIVLVSDEIAELHIFTTDVDDVLKRFPNIKMAMFVEDIANGTASLCYSASGYDCITDSYKIGNFNTVDNRWTVKKSPLRSFDNGDTKYTFQHEKDWEKLNYVFTDDAGNTFRIKER